MAIEIGTVNADTSVKLGTTTIQSGYVGFNQFYNTYTSILDLYPSAYHAFSLRKLKSTYTGACLRVRRTTTTPSATTTTVDLGFDVFNTISLNSPISNQTGTFTNAKTLGEFCASIVNGYSNPDGVNVNQDIFVVTWFDQSGNVKNTTQATAGFQPRLVNVGNLETSNGKVAVRFVKTNSNILSIVDTAVPFNNVSSFVLGNATAVANAGVFLSLNNGTTTRFYLPNQNNISYITGNTFSGFTIVPGDDRLYELVCGTSTRAYSNGTLLTPSSVVSTALTNAFIAIGRVGQSGAFAYADGYISEIISFVGVLNRTGIESNINTYYTIW